jgi:hypothetical protein
LSPARLPVSPLRLILALAVSPLTAPFSTAQPSQLFGTLDPDDGPLVGARKAPDEPAPGLDGARSDVLLGRMDERQHPVPGPFEPRALASLQLPLRI